MDLVSVTGRAVPVTAGMIDINLLAATLTLVNMSAFSFCSALLDVGYDLFVRNALTYCSFLKIRDRRKMLNPSPSNSQAV